MKLLVTGGNGFIGSVVVKKLIDAGYEVRCLLRQTSKTYRIDGLPYEKVLGDIRDFESVLNAAHGCQGIIHLASLSNWNDIHSPDMPKIVLDGTANVLRAAQQEGNIRVVFVSTATAINGSETPMIQNEQSPFTLDSSYVYAYMKHRAEILCKEHVDIGLPVIIVNPAEVYGPHDDSLVTAGTLVDFAKSSPVMICPGGTSIVHVDDVAEGIIKAFEKGQPGERYILGGDNLTLFELAQLSLDILGQQKRIITLPKWLILFVAKAGKMLHLPLPFNPEVIPYAVYYWLMDNTKAKTELGVSFRSARETLEPTIRWLKESGMIT